MREIQSNELGKVLVREVPMPEGVRLVDGTYTRSGRVAVCYRLAGEDKNTVHYATLNDDGTGWHEIFAGEVKALRQGNGLRFMPFADNTRALIGDYILECEPDLDTADPAKSKIVPVHYPDDLVNMPHIWKVWSEIVIAPDNVHMAWNGLGANTGAYIGKLRRTETEYVLDDVHTLTGGTAQPDPEHPGCVILPPVRGGEIKQFVRGGLGISYVGIEGGAGDSMVMALDSEDVHAVTKTPGYDETTIFSPDERLGITMSTRFSPKTNSAYMGLIPRRGNLLVKTNLTASVYLYGVTAVRAGKDGNVGPALVDIQKAQTEPGYLGVNLSDPEGKWVYYSPMSWHPTSKKAMWNEGLRLTLGDDHRLMVAELPDYRPGPAVPAAAIPEHFPYGFDGVDARGGQLQLLAQNAKIAGQYFGYAQSTMDPEDPNRRKVVYENFSDDGKSFLNGWESSYSPGLTAAGESTYDAKLELTGENTGHMDLHVGYRSSMMTMTVELTEDSHGTASYNGTTIDIADMLN